MKHSKRNRGKKAVSLVQRGTGSSPIPSLYPFKMHWFANLNLNAATGLTATYGFRANSLYDPDFTGGGTQPVYFDQLSLLYSKYRVVGVTVKITLSNETEETASMTVYPTMANAPETLYANSTVQRYARTVTLGPKSGGNGVRSISMTVPIWRLWGVAPAVVRAADDFAADVGGNPNNQVYVWIVARNIGTTAAIFRGSVDMVFSGEMHMPRQLPLS